MRPRRMLIAALAVAAIAVAVAVHDQTPKLRENCTATVGDTVARIDLEQARWSSLMAAIAMREGMPARAATIAIAAAFQESKIHNIEYGDRDSVGLFQQRPSQGWGTTKQILDPHYAISKFYQGLAKVDGYTTMEITDAAQQVQRSAFPGAYAQHEAAARALASSLSGYSTAAFSCQINPESDSGDTKSIAKNVDKAFGQLARERAAGRIAYTFDGDPAKVEQRGWALAQYLVAHAAHLGIASVSFDGLRWTAADSPDGWTAYEQASPTRVTASVS